MSKTAAFGPIPGATLTTGDNKPSKKPGYGRYGDWSKEDAIEAIRGKHKEISKPGFFRKPIVGDLNEDRQIEELKKYAESNNVRCKKGEMDKIIEEMVRKPTIKSKYSALMKRYASKIEEYHKELKKKDCEEIELLGHTFKVYGGQPKWWIDLNVRDRIRFPVPGISFEGSREALIDYLTTTAGEIRDEKAEPRHR